MTPEPAAVRRAVSGLALAAALFAAVVLQPTVVSRLPLPGPDAPDLVLLLVTAIAVATSPRCGAVSGFAAGLALDVAPPVTHYAGQDALVFCLAGYGAAQVAGLVRDAAGERDKLTSFAVMAAAAVAGEAAQAALGLLLAEGDVTGAVISRVLPAAVLYDLLLAPAAWWLVARITRGASLLNPRAETAPVPDFGAWSQRGGGRLPSAFRQASAGAVPGLRLAGSGGNYQRPAGRPAPRLRLAGQRTPAVARTGASGPGPASFPRAGGRPPRLNFAGQRPARVAGRPARRPAAMTSAAFRPAPLRAASARPGRRRAVLRRAAFGRAVFGRSVSRRPVSGRAVSGRAVFGRGGSRYRTAPLRSRLGRSRHPWRRRRQRLLRLVGVGR